MNQTVTPRQGFLRRWARLKAQPAPAPAAAPVTVHDQPQAGPAAGQAPPPAPTLADVARLTLESDYAAFLARDVSLAVRRLALKKLFADPNFAVMDGLDIYIDDYTRASPLTGAMLACLDHAPGVLTHLLGPPAMAGGPGDPVRDGEVAARAPADMPQGPPPSLQGKA